MSNRFWQVCGELGGWCIFSNVNYNMVVSCRPKNFLGGGGANGVLRFGDTILIILELS